MNDDNAKPSEPTDPVLNTDAVPREKLPWIIAVAIVMPLTYFSWWFAAGVVYGF